MKRRQIHYGELVYHLIVFAIFACAINVDLGLPPHMVSYAGRAKFYTIWNVCLSIVFYGFSSIVDFIHLLVSHEFHAIRKFRDYTFCSLVVPASVAVSFAFWGLYFVNPDFLLPGELKKYMPIDGFYNHAVHTAPVVTTIMEIVFVYHEPLTRHLIGCLGGLLYGSIYTAWVHWIAYMPDGFWSYPFLEVFTFEQRAVFFIGMYCFGFIWYFTGIALMNAVWRKTYLKYKNE